MVRNFIKKAVPPVAIQALNSIIAKPMGKGLYTGPYRSWDKAIKSSSGYDSDVILSHVSDAVSKARHSSGFERDGVIIQHKDYAYPTLAYLAKEALSHQSISVIDFGGGLGSSFYQAKHFFGNSLNIHWQVVEQPNFVACGQQLQISSDIAFVETIEQCQRTEHDILLVSGVLQYLPDPLVQLKSWAKLGFKSILIDRLPLTSKKHHQIMVQHVPKTFYKASYPSWLFSEYAFEHHLSELGEIGDKFDAIDGQIQTVKLDIQFKGYWLCLT